MEETCVRRERAEWDGEVGNGGEGRGGSRCEGGVAPAINSEESARFAGDSEREAGGCRGKGGGKRVCGSGGSKSVCERMIAAFLDFQVVEEAECNRKIKEDNDNSVTISTIHHRHATASFRACVAHVLA